MLWSKEELITALGSEILHHQLNNDLLIDEVVIDSRKTPKSGLFIALKGDINDAHKFLKQSFDNGCKTLIIEDDSFVKNIPSSNFILVKSTFKALDQLAKFSRSRSSAKIIAITGSVGKTSVKEMLKTAFSAYGKTFATQGNLNNHIGLPLSLANFAADCKFGIFEMGMNHLGEIEPLSKLAKPDLAIITNVEPVHIEYFKDEEEIALAKSEIFSGLTDDGKILLNRDNRHFSFLKNAAGSNDVFSFGSHADSNYKLKSYEITAINSSRIEAINKNSEEFDYKIPSSNKITVFNSLIAFSALDLLTKDAQIGLNALKTIKETPGRGLISECEIDGKKITIIDDSYNASLPSIKAGLEYAGELKLALGKKRVIAALGDMLELGEKSLELHKKIADYLKQYQIDFAILIGDKMPIIAKNLPENSYITFTDSSSASLAIKELLQGGEILYIKGSRGMKMEKIIENLIKI